MSRMKADQRSRGGTFPALLAILLCSCLVVQAATFFDVLVPGINRVAIGGEAAVLAWYGYRAAMEDRWSVLLLGGALIGYMLFSVAYFSYVSGARPNYNIVFSYLTIVLFVPFALYENTFRSLVQILVGVTTVYLLIYVVGHDQILASASGVGLGVLTGNATRSTRLFLALPFASFIGFYALRARTQNLVIRIALFALSTAAIWISGSRTFQILYALVAGLALLRAINGFTRWVMFLAVMAVAGLLLFGLYQEGWNPFNAMSWDDSAYARALEYRTAVETIRQHWLGGIGLAGDFDAMQHFLRTEKYKPLYPTDLGVLGPFLLFGLPGLIAFVLVVYFCIVSEIRHRRTGETAALRLNAILCGVYCILSPTVMLEPGSAFLAMLIALRLRSVTDQAPPPDSAVETQRPDPSAASLAGFRVPFDV
ncbi:O-antigen ligase family protein [Sphingomonas sp.]|uniref:O-antigen ligase family protein n=1 Tax=Sphingomonas sp. TaxID=28214 RepID=UPI003AFFBD6F